MFPPQTSECSLLVDVDGSIVVPVGLDYMTRISIIYRPRHPIAPMNTLWNEVGLECVGKIIPKIRILTLVHPKRPLGTSPERLAALWHFPGRGKVFGGARRGLAPPGPHCPNQTVNRQFNR